MEVITIRTDKTGILKQVCEPVKSFEEIDATIHQMEQLLLGAYNGTGKGLAAPQVGCNKRFFVIRFGNQIDVFINPQIVKYGEKRKKGIEGCLSVPGEWFEVERHKRIEIEYLDCFMKPQRIKFFNFDAVAIQHEYDHLNGICISDKGKGRKVKQAR